MSQGVHKIIKLFKVDGSKKKKTPTGIEALSLELFKQHRGLLSHRSSLDKYSQTREYEIEISSREQRKRVQRYRKGMTTLIDEIDTILSNMNCNYDEDFDFPIFPIGPLRKVFTKSHETIMYVKRILKELKKKGVLLGCKKRRNRRHGEQQSKKKKCRKNKRKCKRSKKHRKGSNRKHRKIRHSRKNEKN